MSARRWPTLTDPWQPALLALVGMTAAPGRRPASRSACAARRPPIRCSACVLVGLGITSLSMAGSAVSAVGAQLAQVTFEQCERAAEAVLGATDSAGARAAARKALSTD